MADPDWLSALLDAAATEGELDAGREPLELAPGDPTTELGRARLATEGAGPLLLGRPLRLEGELAVRALAAAGIDDSWPIPDEVPVLPEGVLVGRLEARFAAAMARSRSRWRGPHLTLGGSAATSFTLEAITLLEPGVERRTALRRLLRSASWPATMAPDALGTFAALGLRSEATLDLGLGLEAGWRAALPGLEELLGALSAGLLLRFDVVTRASFGLALAEELELVMVRAPGLTLEPGWLRLVVRRREDRRLTLGARLSLELGYDLGRPLERLLDRTLERPGWVRLARTLDDLEDLRGAARLAAEGRWTEVAELAGEAGGELVVGLLQRSALLDRRDLERLLGQVADLARAWRALPELVQDLWEELLDGAGLGRGSSLVEALETVAGLDGALERDGAAAVLETLLGREPGTWRQALQLLELLAGHDLEELVVSGDGLEELLRRAAALAERALAFRDRLESLPETTAEPLRQALEETSLAAVLETLAGLESADDLARLVGTQAGSLAARRLGRALDRAEPEDLERLRRWASDLSAVLGAPEHVAALRARLAELEGTIGCSLALELEWASRRTALLDVELDPAHPLARQVLADVAEGSLAGALRRLDAATDDDAPAFRLRDGVFTARRTRASTADVVLSLLGAEGDRTRRIRESWLRAETSPAPSRRVRVSGGLARRVALAGGSATAEVWLSLRADGPGLDPASAFAGPAAGELRLSWTRHEPRLDDGGAGSIRGLLVDLGLGSEGEALNELLQPGLETRVAVTLRLGDGAANALLTADPTADRGWWTDHLNALHRWLSDPMVPWSVPGRPEVPRGAFLAALLRSEGFRELRGAGALELERRLAGRRVTVMATDRDGRRRRVSAELVRQRTGTTSPHPAFAVLSTSAEARLRGGRVLDELGRAGAEVWRGGALPRAVLERAADLFTRALHRAVVDDWPEPSLGAWLVLARLARLAPGALADATGTATLRTRVPGEPEWAEIRTLRLEAGIPTHRPGDREGPFPIRP